MAPHASWPPDVLAESLEARIPQPGVLSQASSARIPQPGFLSQDSSARKLGQYRENPISASLVWGNTAVRTFMHGLLKLQNQWIVNAQCFFAIITTFVDSMPI